MTMTKSHRLPVFLWSKLYAKNCDWISLWENIQFQEFINLESRFEANSKLGPLVRDHQLERPTTWLMESDGGAGDLTVESRRAFLERWVSSLCDRPSLATSSELRKFMAYEDDGNLEFSAVPSGLASNNAAALTHSSSNKIDKVSAN